MIYDTAIIGAGPAGYSAAIYTGRAGLRTIVFGDAQKSNLYKAHTISNYFGVANPLSGPEILSLAQRQLSEFNVESSTTEIIEIAKQDDGSFLLTNNEQQPYRTKTVILATGVHYPLAGIQGEQALTGRGVSYCVTCDGFFFKGRPVVVVGNSDHAAAEALALSAYTDRVTILSHGKPFRFSPVMSEQLAAKKIQTLETPRISAFIGTTKVTDLRFQEPLADGRTDWQVEGVFMAIGTAGASVFAQKLGLAIDNSSAKTNSAGETSVKGLYAAGDCTGAPAQVAASVGSGCIAALSAIKLVRGVNSYLQYN